VGLPADEVIAVAMQEIERMQPAEPVMVTSPGTVNGAVRPSREMSALAPMLLVMAVLGTFAFGRAIIRYVQPTTHADAAVHENAAAAPRADEPSRASADANPVGSPAAAPRTTPATSQVVATNGLDQDARDRANAEAALASLRAQRTRTAATLEDRDKALAAAEGERQSVQALLDTAQSDEDAAAFQKRLDELSRQVETLQKGKARLENDLRSIDRRLKTPPAR
jgi:hypothetical protein